MNKNRRFNRYDNAYLAFAKSYEAFMRMRKRALLSQIDVDVVNRVQANRAQTLLKEAAKFYAAADRLYRDLVKSYRRDRSEDDLIDIEYVQEETGNVGYLVSKLANIFGGEGLKCPETPVFAVAN